jgi:hypothetical protein
MSDLKNVLKAGFLVTASLLATGCGDDNKTTTPTTPAPGGNTGGGSTVQSVISGFTPKIGDAMLKLRAGTNALQGVELPAMPTTGYGAAYDVLKNLQQVTGAASSGAATVSKAVDGKALVDLTSLKMGKTDSLLFDVSDVKKFKATDNHIGALFLDGFIDSAAKVRYVATGKVKGHFRVPALVVRNAVLTGDGAASIAAQYAFVAADAAIGYGSARVDDKGAAKDLSVDVHSIAALSAGTAKAPAAKKTSSTTKVTNTQAAKASATAKVTTPPTKATAGTLVLKSLKLNDADWAKRLNDADLNVHDANTAQFDIAGRVADIEAENANIAGVSDAKPELWIPTATAIAGGGTTTASKTTAKTKAALSAGTAAKSKTSATAGTKTTAKSASTSQTLVKKADGSHHFLFAVKEGDLFAEVGKLVVGPNTSVQAIAHYTLTVHDLTLNADLGFRVLADEHTFEKLDGVPDLTGFNTSGTTPADKIAHGQAMMKLLADADHAVHESDIAEETGATVERYQHYDEQVPFALYVTNTVVNADKHHLVLKAVDLTSSTALSAGVYVLPLVKDFTGLLRSNSGATEIVLGDVNDAPHGTLAVKSWKIMGNGYHDMVLAVQVGAKTAAAALGSGAFERVLMSSHANAGRSVEASRLDAVVARLNPTNLIAASFADVSTSRINQAAQLASLARGVNVATAEKLGAVEHYTASFNHNGTQVGFTYSLNGGDAFTGNKGTTSFGANVASNLLGLTAIVSADASVDAAKNPLASASHASYNAGLTFAKAYNLSGLSVVPMAGFGVASNAINAYSAVVPMAAGALGLHMNDVSFSAATFHAGVSVALDEFVAATAGVNTSLAFGVAGYLAATANATLSTSEGKSADLQFGGSSVAPYAQFNLGFASGEKVNALISTGVAAVNFGIDR